jgi:hypothetical protein
VLGWEKGSWRRQNGPKRCIWHRFGDAMTMKAGELFFSTYFFTTLIIFILAMNEYSLPPIPHNTNDVYPVPFTAIHNDGHRHHSNPSEKSAKKGTADDDFV